MKYEATVTIKQERYEMLQDTETRVHVLVDMLMNETYVDKEKILLYLGYKEQYIKLKEKEEREERKRRNESINKRD